MTTSRLGGERDRAFVWIWLPGEAEPVVAGQLTLESGRLAFTYGRSYLGRDDAIPIYEPELPLRPGRIEPLPGLESPGCIRDAAPDAWGRRVIVNRLSGVRGADIDVASLGELIYLLKSGSDRAGALDFQLTPDRYEPRLAGKATLEELIEAAERVETGVPLSPDLAQALFHGSSIGGARPKALIDEADRKLIAKFSAAADLYSVVKAEFIAMRLARAVGLNAAEVRLVQAAGKDVLLVERFDRAKGSGGWTRRAFVSALTLLGLDEMLARYASYADLAEIARRRFVSPRDALRELFGRLVFNVLCGNTDDHARNHAAFWAGATLELTPAYDVCPQARAGGEATQAMLIDGDDRLSRIATCLRAAHLFHMDRDAAKALVAGQLDAVGSAWPRVCDDAGLSATDRSLLWGRQFLNPYAFEQLEESDVDLAVLADAIRRRHS